MYTADLRLPRQNALELYRLQFFYTKARAELALSARMQGELKILNGTAAIDPDTNSNASDKASENEAGEDEQPMPDTTSDTTADPSAALKGWESAERYYESCIKVLEWNGSPFAGERNEEPASRVIRERKYRFVEDPPPLL